jgi:hypothetical protein
LGLGFVPEDYEVRVMALVLFIFSILTLFPNASYSWSTDLQGRSFTGVWKGGSVCQIKDSACHDEASVYYVSPGSEPNTFQMKMNKIVDGKEETIGTVNCTTDSNVGSYVCRLNPTSTWTWWLNKTSLDGEMQYRGQVYRKIHLVRQDKAAD